MFNINRWIFSTNDYIGDEMLIEIPQDFWVNPSHSSNNPIQQFFSNIFIENQYSSLILSLRRIQTYTGNTGCPKKNEPPT